MIARGSHLHAIAQRRIMSSGAIEVLPDHIAVSSFDIEIVKEPPRSSRDYPKGPDDGFYRAGHTLRFTSTMQIGTRDNVGFISYPTELYRIAMLSGPTVLDKHNKLMYISFHVQLLADLDIASLGPVKIFLEGE